MTVANGGGICAWMFIRKNVSARRKNSPKVFRYKNMFMKRIDYFLASFYPNGLLGTCALILDSVINDFLHGGA